MSDKTLYFSALERLSSITSGSSDFEKICLKLIKSMYPDYDFEVSEGGEGTKDGGYDGHASLKKAKLACSIEKDYKGKIKSEVEKSIKNSDLQLFYLSNQRIPEPEKNRIKTSHINADIDLIIFGIDVLSQELENYFQVHNDPELYDLLCLSFLKVGERYSRGDVKHFDISFNGNIYKKRIVIIDKNQHYNIAEPAISENPLLDYILSCCSERKLSSFMNITLCGIGYLGKSFLMKMTFDTLIKEFSDKNSFYKYQFIPFIQFRELKYYSRGIIEDIVKNNIDPLLVFLDGLDELNESKRIDLNSEIQNILINNNRVRFIISGRNSSFINFDIFPDSAQLYLEKYTYPSDKELINLIEEYSGTPIADLLPIPTYRNFVLEKRISRDSKLEEFYNLLVQNNLKRDKEKRDRSNNITQRMTSEREIDTIINEISEFCYELFIHKKNVFTESDLKEYIINENHFLFVIYSAIIDYHDKNNISFISNFYYEYFVSNALLTKGKNTIFKIFFTREKIKIPSIDLLMLFLSCAKTGAKNKYNFIKRKMCKDNIACILLCEFDSIDNSERYEHFIAIFKYYKKEKKSIYFERFRQVYGPLKNIDNLARRMQQLLPDCYKTNGINFLVSEIMSFLQGPSKDNVLSFGNAVSLLIPFINNIWSEKEQIILKKISISLIRFFLNNNLSNELNNILSEKYIFDWYKIYNWTENWEKKEWDLFYEDISGKTCNLLSEISGDYEYRIKFDIFTVFYIDYNIKSLLFPILRYALKNKYIYGHSMATTVPEMINDDYETPLIKTDDRIFILLLIIKQIELDLPEILDLLIFTIENKLYRQLKNSYDNLINTLEEILYKNLTLLENNHYKKFSQYYLYTDEHEFDDRLFQREQAKEIEKIKEFIVCEILDIGITKWKTPYFLQKLINFSDVEHSLEYLFMIKEKAPKNIYIDVVYYIFNNKDHILSDYKFVINEYNNLFEKEILKNAEKKKLLENIKNQIEIVNNNDILLMLDPNAMIDELYKINNFLQSPKMIDNERTPIGKLFSLNHEAVKNIIEYNNLEDTIPPILSECAIKIMEDFYRSDVFDIDIIIKKLQEYLFKEDKYYIYFYWFFIARVQKNNELDIKYLVDNYPDLEHKIINSLDKDASEIFIKKSFIFFEQYDNNYWLAPFFYYFETLLNCVPPTWMQIEHILKLIVVPDPDRSRGVIINPDLSLNWLIDKFPVIESYQLIEYGLNIIENLTYRLPRLQIVNYFIDYYKSNGENILTERILNFIINDTKKLFALMETDHEYGEFQYIAQFWEKCNSNYIDYLFPKITVNTITSAIRRNEKDFDYHYRKNVLLYCSRLSTIEQKIRMIYDIEENLVNEKLSDKENDEVHGFLASLGREKSIKLIINSYLNGKAIHSRYSYSYPLGFIKQNNDMLNDFTQLFIYSTEKSNERRSMLLQIAQDGIKQHITKKNFKIFEKRILKELKKIKKQTNWRSEFYSEFFLKMEQFVMGS
jgi:hypothetical protein